MKKILLLFFVLASLVSFSQGIQTGGIFLRVVDSAAYVNSTYVTVSHTNGYADTFYSTSSQLFWRWNGSAYKLISSIYTDNGTMPENRSVNGGGHNIDFTNFNDFIINTTDDLEYIAVGGVFIEGRSGTAEQSSIEFSDSGIDIKSDAGDILIQAGNNINIDASGDVQLNSVSGTSGEFIGNVDGHLVWAVPPGSGASGGSAVLDVETTSVGNVGIGVDTLFTYTLPADTLSTNGQFIRGRISGIFALNDNDKTLRLEFGGTTILTRLAINTPSVGQAWLVDWEVIRTGATTQKTNATFGGIDGTAAAFYTETGETLSGPVEIVLTGESSAASDNDLVKHSSVITWGISAGGGGGGLAISDFVTSETPTGDVDGVNDTYTLAFTPAANLHFFINGLLQEEGGGNDYTIAGDTITTTSPPAPGSILSVSYIK